MRHARDIRTSTESAQHRAGMHVRRRIRGQADSQAQTRLNLQKKKYTTTQIYTFRSLFNYKRLHLNAYTSHARQAHKHSPRKIQTWWTHTQTISMTHAHRIIPHHCATRSSSRRNMRTPVHKNARAKRPHTVVTKNAALEEHSDQEGPNQEGPSRSHPSPKEYPPQTRQHPMETAQQEEAKMTFTTHSHNIYTPSNIPSKSTSQYFTPKMNSISQYFTPKMNSISQYFHPQRTLFLICTHLYTYILKCTSKKFNAVKNAHVVCRLLKLKYLRACTEKAFPKGLMQFPPFFVLLLYSMPEFGKIDLKCSFGI